MKGLETSTTPSETCSWQKDTCIEDLKSQISPFYFQECEIFINRVRELRHQSVLERQLSKFEHLWQRFRGGHSNNKNGCSKIQYQNQGEMTSPTNSTTVDLGTTIETTSTEATNTVIPVITTSTSTTTDMATTNDYINKWVRNLSSIPLTEAQVSLLAHGPNYAVAPRHPPMGKYITVIQQACMKLEPHNAEKLRAEMRGVLRHSQEPKRSLQIKV